jgi:penicillin V acylase-like amidase (Ntn superfamily)
MALSIENRPYSFSRIEKDWHSCSTFMLEYKDEIFIGHSLDDSIDVPGLIVVNKRNTEKENVSWEELWPEPFWSRRIKQVSPRKYWRSKYGSITYNTNGKEFIDGGLNEAGLYVGEMNLLETIYPHRDDLPKMYHHQWLQFLLDNFESVDQVITSLDEIVVGGHCTWHFFVGDKKGQVAVIEFLEGQPVVYTGENLPLKLLCNTNYEAELKFLKTFKGFGGTQQIDFADSSPDTRFVRGAAMIQNFHSNPSQPIQDYAFKILRQIKGGNNKWGLLYDLKRFKLYFYTYIAPQTRYLNFSDFDLSENTPVMVLDIHQDLSGDVSQHFTPFVSSKNTQYMGWKAIKEAKMGGVVDRYIRFPEIMRRMTNFATSFKPKE